MNCLRSPYKIAKRRSTWEGAEDVERPVFSGETVGFWTEEEQQMERMGREEAWEARGRVRMADRTVALQGKRGQRMRQGRGVLGGKVDGRRLQQD